MRCLSPAPLHARHTLCSPNTVFPLLGGADTSPSSSEAQPRKPAQLLASRRAAAWSLCPGSGPPEAWEGLAAVGHGAEPTKHLLEPCCRTLLSQKEGSALLPCSYGSASQKGHLRCHCSPCGVTGHPSSRHRLSEGLEREMGMQGVTGCCVLGLCPLVHRADRSYHVPLCSSTRRQLCRGAGWTLMQDPSGPGCLPLPFIAEQWEVSLAASWGQGPRCALSLQPLQAASPLGPPAAMHPVSGRDSKFPGSHAHSCSTSLGFGICDCSNYLLQ